MNNIIEKTSDTILQIINHKNFLIYCFLLFVVIRLVPILLVPVTPTSDANWYYSQGISISEGMGYLRNGKPTAFWPVGYPAFLAALFKLFGTDVIVGQIANLVLSSIGFFILLALVRKVSYNEQVARLSVLILTLYPNNIAYNSILLSETLFTTLMLLGCWLWIARNTYIWAIVTGVIFGLTTLVKTQTVLFPVVLIGYSFFILSSTRFSNRVVVKGALLFICLFVTVSPWTIRNYHIFGEFVFVSTNGGISMLAGNNPSVKPDFKNDFNVEDPLVKSTGHPYADEIEVNQKSKKLAIEWIKENLGQFMSLIPHKLWRLWAPDGEAEWAYQAMKDEYDRYYKLFRSLRVFNQGYYVLIIICVLIFPLVFIKTEKREADNWIWLGYLFASYVSIISIFFSGQSRYHFPVMPFLAIPVAWLLVHILSNTLRISDVKQEGIGKKSNAVGELKNG